MRVTPIGLVFAGDLMRTEQVARRSAAITHVHPLGMEGAVVQALSVNLALQLPPGPLDSGSFLDSLGRFGLSQTFLGALEKVRDLLPSASHSEVVEILGNGIEAHRSVPAALFAFLSSVGDFERAIEFAVRLGGDTDTIAAMTGALAGAAWGSESIPARWIERAEGGKSMLRMAEALLEEALEQASIAPSLLVGREG